jgi:hypothetical protein
MYLISLSPHCSELFVDQVFTTTNVDDETFKATKPYFSERELVEITIMVGMYRMLAGFLNTFAIPMEEVTDNFNSPLVMLVINLELMFYYQRKGIVEQFYHFFLKI